MRACQARVADADQHGPVDPELVHDRDGVGDVLDVGVRRRVERPVRAAVAARVDGHHPEVPREVGHLGLPHGAVHDQVDRREDHGGVAVAERLVADAHTVALDPALQVRLSCSHGISLPATALQPGRGGCSAVATGLQRQCGSFRGPASTRMRLTGESHMTTTTQSPPIDMDELMAFVGKFVGDLGATIGAGNVLLGERLGLYRALAAGAADSRVARLRHRHGPAVRRGVAARPGGGRLHPVRRRVGDVLDDARAGLRAHRSRRAGVPARRLSSSRSGRCGRRPPSRPRSATAAASAGTSTTTTSSPAASASSARAT